MRFTFVVAAGMVVFLLAAPTARAEGLHSSTFSGALVEMETSSASAFLIGSDGTIARAAAFDTDGTLFTTVNSGRFLGKFDLTSGAISLVGPLLSTGAMDAIEIDASGQLYGITMGGLMYRIDKTSGTPTYLSNIGLRNVVDLAYDPAGNLWAVSVNRLYWIDVATGTYQFVGSIGGAREGNVFGIAFDGDGRLWATSTTLDAPLYEVDLDTLAAYLVGYTGVDYPRGCDIYVTAPSPEPAPPTDTDADGIPDDVDAFPNSDMRSTVWVGDLDTGVPNVFFSDGATIADLVAACAQDVHHHGTFVSRVAHLGVSLRKDGWISGAQRGAIQRAAAKFLRED